MPGEAPSTTPRHPIGLVARRTGLKPDLIRAWERRYNAVEPGRSSTRRRFYSDADVERLQLLRQVVRTGRGIGQVARLSDDELRALLAEEPPEPPERSGSDRSDRSDRPDAGLRRATPFPEISGEIAEAFLSLCLAAAHRLDAPDLESQIERASVVLSRTNLLEKLLVPLLHRIGELWKEGSLRPAHEHLVSAVIRSFLGSLRGAHSAAGGGPHLVVTTPARQHHELGALIVAATATSEGWQVTYLGPDLPPEEIAAAVFQGGAQAVALSITYPPDDPLLVEDLKRLRRLLAPETALLVGGRSAAAYASTLREIGALYSNDLAQLRQELENLRARRIDSIS
jgi:DNA-binding transcriptional MerR regulator/methylmalonyl-CoA mutase cobalamin-binding subunit